MDLYEWVKHYISFRDAMRKQIIDTKYLETMIVVQEKSEQKLYFIFEHLEDCAGAIKKINGEKATIITLNTKENADYLIKQWEIFSEKKDLTIIFAHPGTNEKWLIHPVSHNKISERKQLKESIYTLLESVGRA